MKYRKGYKYQLAEDEVFYTNIKCGKDITTQFITLDRQGVLIVKSGYAWDGASGPTIDTITAMRGPCAHDALYQLIRMGELQKIDRQAADNFMYQCLIEDGMWKLRATFWRREVKKFASFAADPKNVKKVYVAPSKKYIQPKRRLDI